MEQFKFCSLQGLPTILLIKVTKHTSCSSLCKLIIGWPAAEGAVREFENEILVGIFNFHSSAQISRMTAAVMLYEATVRTHYPMSVSMN